MGFRDESDMQSRIALLLKTGGFASAIKGKDKIAQMAKDTSDTFPIFAIDRVARSAMIAAAAGLLEELSDLSILTEDENVSAVKSETLRPDFVCISAENQSIFLIELKNSAQTAREAITELLGYEHEIKNYLPFLADWDLNYIIISAEWSTLLDHSTSSACCWSKKKLLCLEADLVGEEVQLKPRIPSAWTITGAVRFPAGSMPTFQISIDQHEDGFDERFRLVLNLLGRIGDRLGAHGFAMLWKDRLFRQNNRYHITLAAISPASFFKAALERGNIRVQQGRLAKPLLNAVRGEEATPQSLLRLYSEIKPILQEFSSSEIEGFFDWSVAEQTYLFRAEP